MDKRFLRIALLTTPIIALYGVTPLFLFNQVKIGVALELFIGLFTLIFFFWIINIKLIELLSKLKNRYVWSYGLTFFTQVVFMGLGSLSGMRPDVANFSFLYPISSTFAINSIILVVANMVLYRIQKESAENEVKELKVSNLEAQKQVLMQQLQPHFLFNALSVLKSLIADNQAIAEDYTQRLSDFLRYSVQSNTHEIVTLEDELKFTQDYVDLQKVRFGDAIQFERNISMEFLHGKVPIFAIQTLVENAIKHNSFTEKRPLNINISIEKNRIKVDNNRFVKRQIQASGTGLKNLNERYKLIDNKAIEIQETEQTFIVYLDLL